MPLRITLSRPLRSGQQSTLSIDPPLRHPCTVTISFDGVDVNTRVQDSISEFRINSGVSGSGTLSVTPLSDDASATVKVVLNCEGEEETYETTLEVEDEKQGNGNNGTPCDQGVLEQIGKTIILPVTLGLGTIALIAYPIAALVGDQEKYGVVLDLVKSLIPCWLRNLFG